MSRLRLLKTVALCFVEAARVTLEQLGARRLELNDDSSRVVAEMSRVYADVRRLRDHLHTCVNGFGDTVEIDLTPEDTAVLVACCRRTFDQIEARLASDSLRPEERRTLKDKQQVIARWAIELAAPPLLELPLRRLTIAGTDATRQFHAKLIAKVTPKAATREGQPVAAPTAGIGSASTLGADPVAVAPMDPADDPLLALGSNPIASAPLPAQAEPPRSQAGSAYPPSPAGALPPGQWRGQPPPPPVAPLFNTQRLLDPRLRALATLDLQSYANAVAANDLRMASVMLASLLEAALIDHVMPRRHEYEVSGDPIGWDLQAIILCALGANAQAADRALVRHVFASRNMLRPAMQFLSPAIVTPNSFASLRKFTLRCLHTLGYGVAGE
jgi:hypothetical protein